MAPPRPAVQIQGMGAISADNANTYVQTVTNYAALRAFPALTNMVAYAQGAATPGDGGQSLFWYNSSSVATDNNSTVIVPTGQLQGAWLALSVGQVQNLLVTGTLTVDGAASFLAAVTMAATLGVTGVSTFASDIIMSGTGELQLPAGTTAQRSGAPVLGMERYNTTLGVFEGYGATGWQPLAGAITSGVFPGEIFGLLPSSIAGTSTTASLSVSSGKAVDSTGATILSLSGATAWSVTNGNAINGYQGGTTLPNSNTIHFFICQGASGTGIFASLSATTPTLPVGYASFFRRIFSVVTTSGGALIPFTADEINGGAMCAYLTTPTTDINGATLTSVSRTLYSMNVPSGIKVQWQGTFSAGVSNFMLITSPDETDTAPGSTTAGPPTFDQTNVQAAAVSRRITITNTGGQIGVRAQTGTPVGYAETFGWVDFRRT